MIRAAQIIGICLTALLMSEIYLHTKRPKLYAFVSIASGCAALLIYKLMISTGSINFFNVSIAAVLGVPGVILCAALEVL